MNGGYFSLDTANHCFFHSKITTSNVVFLANYKFHKDTNYYVYPLGFIDKTKMKLHNQIEN